VRIIVNHLTRMRSPRICVAGINTASFEHVRPVTPSTDLITRELLRDNDGPFSVGALVDLGDVVPCPKTPQTEDHEFNAMRAERIKDLTDDEYLYVLGKVSDADFQAAFGPDLVTIRPRKLAVPAGCGTQSLAVVHVVEPKLQIIFGKLYLVLASPIPAAIRITDVRFYEPDETIKRGVVKDVNRRLASGVTAYAMLGLAQAKFDEDGGDVHWLMANGLCLADRPVGDVP
jgi:hypothetical protein